jgi:hypothetical protein
MRPGEYRPLDVAAAPYLWLVAILPSAPEE